MAIPVTSVDPNQTIQAPGLSVYSGVVECVFKSGDAAITRDTLTFVLPDPRINLVFQPVQASSVVSVAGFWI